jgi:UDP-glucose:(heptosyl)LPS alpha-1,3-glucosyltransferase
MLECATFLQARGHDTHVFATDWDHERLRGVAIHPIASSSLSWRRMKTFACESERQLGLLHPPAEVLAAFGVQSPPGGVMWVQSVHKAWIEISRQLRCWRGRLKQRLNPFHATALALEQRYFGERRYRRLIALTPQVKADLERLYNVPSADIDVLPNGFSHSEFNVARAQGLRAVERAALGYVETDRVVVFVANELDRKGFWPLLESVAALGDRNVRLLVVGRVNQGRAAGEVARLGLADRVKFTGPSGDVARYYAAADVFALPTQYEAWGLVIVEAMACGLPVVTSRLAGAAVAVNEGQSGYLLDDPGSVDEIASLLRQALAGKHAPRHAIAESVSPYAWEQILPRYEQILIRCAKPSCNHSIEAACAAS